MPCTQWHGLRHTCLHDEHGEPKKPDGISLTVYSSADPAGFDPQRFISQQRAGNNPGAAWAVPGFGLVRETRTVSLDKGQGELRFTDVAAFIDPTTVGFRDLDGKGTKVFEQNFEFDLVNASKLLEKYLDRKVQVTFGEKTHEGTLLSSSNGSVVLAREGGGIEILPMDGAAISTEEDLPQGLITRPTLVWKVFSPVGGERMIQTTYETAGLTWRADYNLILNEDSTKASLTAWVSLMNLSGMAYENAALKLIAGDVQRVRPTPKMMRPEMMSAGRGVAMADGFTEESFFEYHLYTLPRKTDVKSNGTQQITLFPQVSGFPIEKELVYAPSRFFGYGEPRTQPGFSNGASDDIKVFVTFLNEKSSGLGMPFPAGKVRSYMKNPNDGALEFIGEDMIDHTPRNERIRLGLGNSFDVVGERLRTDFKSNKAQNTMSESFTIELRNQKDVAQKGDRPRDHGSGQGMEDHRVEPRWHEAKQPYDGVGDRSPRRRQQQARIHRAIRLVDMQTISEIREILNERGLHPKHRLGQNFLHDQNQLRRLLEASEVGKGDLVLEVGPGTGTLTEALVDRGCEVITSELDTDMGDIIESRLGAEGDVDTW